MSKTLVVMTCSHATPEVSNDRFSWLGQFLYDLRPDTFVHLGDRADMKSLNSFDKGKPTNLSMQSYEKDIECSLDADYRVWELFRKNKRRMPHRIGIEGNHEDRIRRAVSSDPRLAGDTYGISMKHLRNSEMFDEYHEFADTAPAIVDIEGMLVSHYLQSPNSAGAISGRHHAAALVDRLASSVAVGHSHKLDYHRKADAYPRPISGLVAGCFKGARESWAGQSNNGWTSGIAVLHSFDKGDYDLQWVSLKALQKEYG